jgi:uncharacterized protein (TIGR02145 family)
MEDGKDIGGATAAVYTVPSDKAEGNYTYIRRSKKEGCDWASSNAYTVEVFTCGTITPDAPIGTKGSFQDPRDQKVYKTVKMPDGKVWMAENLNYQSGLTFNQQANQANGQPYPNMDNGVPAIGSFWCPAVAGATLSADKNTCNVYGALYTWETAMSADGGKEDIGGKLWNESSVLGRYHDNTTKPVSSDPTNIKGVCPIGWHLPSDYEWATLLDKVDTKASSKYVDQLGIGWYGSEGLAGSDNEGAGAKLKSASTYVGIDPGNSAWVDNTNRGNNATGFGAVPGGCRSTQQFAYRGTYSFYWSSSVGSSSAAWYRTMTSGLVTVQRSFNLRSQGLPVRCLED